MLKLRKTRKSTRKTSQNHVFSLVTLKLTEPKFAYVKKRYFGTLSDRVRDTCSSPYSCPPACAVVNSARAARKPAKLPRKFIKIKRQIYNFFLTFFYQITVKRHVLHEAAKLTTCCPPTPPTVWRAACHMMASSMGEPLLELESRQKLSLLALN